MVSPFILSLLAVVVSSSFLPHHRPFQTSLARRRWARSPDIFLTSSPFHHGHQHSDLRHRAPASPTSSSPPAEYIFRHALPRFFVLYLFLVHSLFHLFSLLRFTSQASSLEPPRWHRRRHPHCRADYIFDSPYSFFLTILISGRSFPCHALPVRQLSKSDFAFAIFRSARTIVARSYFVSGLAYHTRLTESHPLLYLQTLAQKYKGPRKASSRGNSLLRSVSFFLFSRV